MEHVSDARSGSSSSPSSHLRTGTLSSKDDHLSPIAAGIVVPFGLDVNHGCGSIRAEGGGSTSGYSKSEPDDGYQVQKGFITSYNVFSGTYPLEMPIRGMKQGDPGLPCSRGLFAILISMAYHLVQETAELSPLVDIGGNCRDTFASLGGRQTLKLVPLDINCYFEYKDPLHLTGVLELLWNWNYLYGLQPHSDKYPPTPPHTTQAIVCSAFHLTSTASLGDDLPDPAIIRRFLKAHPIVDGSGHPSTISRSRALSRSLTLASENWEVPKLNGQFSIHPSSIQF
jgi:hypothetical protein